MGTWIGHQLASGPILPSGVRMRYAVLLPDAFQPSERIPVVLWMHTNDSGNRSYPNGDPVHVAIICGADGWFNNTAYQDRHRSIVVVPSCDQTTDSGGTTENFGGYGPVNAPNEQSLPLVAQEVLATYGGDPSRVYGAGGSLGGISCWGLALDHNVYNGTFTRTFAALMPEAGMLVRDGVTPASAKQQLAAVPIFAIHGAGDTTSPIGWDDGVWAEFSGGAPTVGPPNGAHADNSNFWYLRDPNRGHDVWDYYPPMDAGMPMWDWMFSQSATGVPVVVPTPTPSDDGTTVPPEALIMDASGNTWTITSGGQVAVNLVADNTTRNVIELEYTGGRVYQQNASHGWWSKARPSDAWLLGAPPTVTPPPPPPPTGITKAKIIADAAKITDAVTALIADVNSSDLP